MLNHRIACHLGIRASPIGDEIWSNLEAKHFRFCQSPGLFVGPLQTAREREQLAEPHRTTQGQHGQQRPAWIGRMTVPLQAMSWPCSVPNIIPVLRERAERTFLVIANLTNKTRRCSRQFRLHSLRATLSPSGEGLCPCNLARAITL